MATEIFVETLENPQSSKRHIDEYRPYLFHFKDFTYSLADGNKNTLI